MDRSALEQLDRETLIARAEQAGVSRASILTRPELIDELLMRGAARPDDPALRKVRGFFGRARDLLARVIERGLNLPDAAERVRQGSGWPPPPPPSTRAVSTPLPTVTLAEIYAAQGHRGRAVDTLKKVLELEPDHGEARALLTRLEDHSYVVPEPKMPPEEDDYARSLADAPTTTGSEEMDADAPTVVRATFGGDELVADAPTVTKSCVDECIAIPVDPTTLFVCSEVTDRRLEQLRQTEPEGVLTLRILIVVPTWEGPSSSTRDLDVTSAPSDVFVRDLPAGAVLRVAVGWRKGPDFTSIAHSPSLEMPASGARGQAALLRWTPQGTMALGADDRDASSIERAFTRFTARSSAA